MHDVRTAIAIDMLKLRRLRRLTQVQAAKKAGVPLRVIRNIESGDGVLRVGSLEKVIRALRGRFSVSTPRNEMLSGFHTMGTT